MGWASGSALMLEVIAVIMVEVSDPDIRERIYRPIVKAFKQNDWDTESECIGQDEAFDRVMKERHPGWFEDDDEPGA